MDFYDVQQRDIYMHTLKSIAIKKGFFKWCQTWFFNDYKRGFLGFQCGYKRGFLKDFYVVPGPKSESVQKS